MDKLTRFDSIGSNFGGHLKRRLLDLAPRVLATLMLVSAVAIAFISSDVRAESSNGSTNFIVTVEATIAITASTNEVAVELNPTAVGTFGYGSTVISVSTGNPTGYTLTMADEDNNTDLKHITPTVSDTLPSITTNTQLANFNNNTWGYSLDNNTYKKIPTNTNADTLKTTNAPTANDNTTVYFGAKANTDLPSGVYKDTIVFTATTNYVPEPIGFFTMTNMQEMTPEICDSVVAPSNTATTIVTSASTYTDPATQVPEVTLTDTRDNKQYKVRKLADGNCWMSENLRLGGTSAISLNSTNSNLPSGSTFTLPIAETSANHTAWAADYDDEIGANTPHVYNTENDSYGNYYNWYTAVAGTANYSTVSQDNSGTITPNDAPGSICPKGWYLPGNGNNADYNNLLITTYGLTETAISNSTNATKIQASPLSFVLGGGYFPSSSGWQADNQSQVGGYWSRTPFAEQSDAFGLNFRADGLLYPQGVGYKVYGGSVRCVASSAPSAPFHPVI